MKVDSLYFDEFSMGIDNFLKEQKDLWSSRNMVLLAAINSASFDFVITYVNLGAFGERNFSAGINKSSCTGESSLNFEVEKEMETDDEHCIVYLCALHEDMK